MCWDKCPLQLCVRKHVLSLHNSNLPCFQTKKQAGNSCAFLQYSECCASIRALQRASTVPPATAGLVCREDAPSAASVCLCAPQSILSSEDIIKTKRYVCTVTEGSGPYPPTVSWPALQIISSATSGSVGRASSGLSLVCSTHSCGLAGPLPAARLQSPPRAARRCSQSPVLRAEPGHAAPHRSQLQPQPRVTPLQLPKNLRFPLSVLSFSYPFTSDYITDVWAQVNLTAKLSGLASSVLFSPLSFPNTNSLRDLHYVTFQRIK